MIDRKRRALSVSLSLTLAGIAAARAQASNDERREVIDDRGRTVVLTHEPKRLATISYFGADTALALGSKPVASTFLVRGRPPAYLLGRMDGVLDLGQRANASLELIVRSRCDLIVAIRRYTEANAAKLEQIAPYLALDLETFDDSDRNIALVGTALGKPNEARALNERFARTLAEYRARVSAPRTSPRYLFIWGTGTAPWAFYDENMTCSILNALGAINVAGRNPLPAQRDNTAFQISLERMLIADPDMIFVYDDGPARAFQSNAVWQHLNAVRHSRVLRVGDHWIESFGPVARHAVLAEAARAFYPEQFPAADLHAIAESYFA